MGNTKLSLFFILFISFLSAQNKSITLDEIWGNNFKTASLQELHSMKDGKGYTVLNTNEKGDYTIDVYDYKTLSKQENILSSKELNEISEFSSFKFSEDESKILLETQKEDIYRHSKRAIYYVYDRASRELTKVADEKIQEPTFSPNASKVAYVHNNNLFVKDLSDGTLHQLTSDGEKNKIINGVSDWVYEEEFSFVRAYHWNSSGDYIAFLKFDETEVPVFSMDMFGEDLYPFREEFKYPKAGETNPVVSLHINDLSSNSIIDVDFGETYTDFYIPRFKWTAKPNILSVQLMNRAQNKLDLWFVNVDGSKELILSEEDAAYVDITDNLTFLKDNSFIWTSEQDGFNHIYHYNSQGKLINQITKGGWDVTDFYGFDEANKKIYYQSVEEGSIHRDVYSIDLSGKNKRRLSNEAGFNSAEFSSDFNNFINTFSNSTTPPVYTLRDSKGKVLKVIEDNKAISSKVNEYQFSPKEFSTLQVNGYNLNMWTVKPPDFDPTKKYPLLMHQYSGPGSQQVSNRWMSSNDYWFQFLANNGFVIVSVDGRGTGYKGSEFKKMTQLQLGKYEVEDQIEAARILGKLPYIDPERIGIWGWSYGGFMSSNALFQGSDTFKTAIAVAPVTSWRFYDTVYTERYMSTPQENPSGYDDNSPINHVDKLKGDFLLIHGSADDNVHVQNTMRLIEALVQANKDFDWLIYPDKNHGISGGNTRLHLYNKMTDFLFESLKSE